MNENNVRVGSTPLRANKAIIKENFQSDASAVQEWWSTFSTHAQYVVEEQWWDGQLTIEKLPTSEEQGRSIDLVIYLWLSWSAVSIIWTSEWSAVWTVCNGWIPTSSWKDSRPPLRSCVCVCVLFRSSSETYRFCVSTLHIRVPKCLAEPQVLDQRK